VDVIRALPAGSVVRWGDDTSGETDILSGYLDVWAPLICRPLEWNWLWTIAAPKGDASAAGQSESPLNLTVVYDIAGATNGWTVPLVNRVLEEWVSEHAGRSDLRFHSDHDLTSDWVLESLSELA
jgi:hypothetical protein